uniref:Uncharacterized protein n=1 Tax=Bionectria ochroleuca TaxID=29856 RepID=A0A8H7TTU2_BIOOC
MHPYPDLLPAKRMARDGPAHIGLHFRRGWQPGRAKQSERRGRETDRIWGLRPHSSSAAGATGAISTGCETHPSARYVMASITSQKQPLKDIPALSARRTCGQA